MGVPLLAVMSALLYSRALVCHTAVAYKLVLKASLLMGYTRMRPQRVKLTLALTAATGEPATAWPFRTLSFISMNAGSKASRGT